ncbi:sialidase family protein [Sphingobacterium psychroaquaticum]|uniref:Predicted neuraminidase (Sialidase) n=1 Tax=Sphingobacterium psychroaquaticum TaxID=561061 RepID=A0A1X7K0N4_9SPHI|nr:sialidase family protein [Sphingobacterium psychroaquaticum]SMG34469.1 Predicted neuraminidase (sialidase) [Sphingobacterium psychroaquaticum]
MIKKIGYGLALCVSSFLVSTTAYGQQPKIEIVKQELLFTEGAHFAQCHASTIEENIEGQLVAAWFAGSHEGHADVAIWGSVRQGNRWSEPTVWANGKTADKTHPCWNPVLFRPKGAHKIYLYYKVGPNPRTWWGMVKTSDDGGLSWSEAKRLPEGILGPIKNKPLEIQDGTILAPSSVELTEDRWVAHVEITNKEQQIWTAFPIDQQSAFNVIQPSLIQHQDGRIQALCRSKEGAVISSWSHDQGRTWSTLAKTNLINPNSATDAIRVDNYLLMVYNPDIPGKDWWEGRTKLRLAYSYDGLQWEDLLVLEDQEKGEFSYPTIIQDIKGFIHVTYTDNRKNIKHVVLATNND